MVHTESLLEVGLQICLPEVVSRLRLALPGLFADRSAALLAAGGELLPDHAEAQVALDLFRLFLVVVTCAEQTGRAASVVVNVTLVVVLDHLVDLRQDITNHSGRLLHWTDLAKQVVADQSNLAAELGSLLVCTRHQDVRVLFLLAQQAPALFDELVTVSALQKRVRLLDFWDLVASVEPVSSQEAQLSSRLDGLVLTTVAEFVDLRPQLVLLHLEVLDCLEVRFPLRLSHLVKLFPFLISDPILPLVDDELLDVLGRQVRHPRLDLVEHLVLEELDRTNRLLGELDLSQLLLKLPDLLELALVRARLRRKVQIAGEVLLRRLLRRLEASVCLDEALLEERLLDAARPLLEGTGALLLVPSVSPGLVVVVGPVVVAALVEGWSLVEGLVSHKPHEFVHVD